MLRGTNIVVSFILCLSLLGTSSAQQTFTAGFSLSGSTLANGGVVSGTLTYSFDAKSFVLSFPQYGYSELYAYNSVGGTNGNYQSQYLHKISDDCSGKCETSDLRQPCPKIFPDPTVYNKTAITKTIGSQQCTRYVPLDNTYPVTEAWFTTAGVACRITLEDGRTLTFTSSSLTADTSLFTPPTDCKCGEKIDIILVLDGSASIVTSDWAAVNQFVKLFASSFTFSPLSTGLGIIQFSTGQQTELVLTTSQAAVNAKVASDMRQLRGSTCITCGLAAAVQMILQGVNRSATPVIITMTDGAHNVLRYSTQCRTPECDIVYGMNLLKEALPNAITYAVGVGDLTQPSQLLLIAGNKSENVYQFNTFTHFMQNFSTLATRSCDITNSTRCGSCCGFCTCGTCFPPEACDDGDLCTTNVYDPYADCCVPPTPKCVNPDKCTIASCDPSSGQCSTTPRSCAYQTCKNVTCNPELGCQYTPKCVDKDLCTPRTCVNDTCVDVPKDCGQNDACTLRACNLTSGYCTLKDLSAKCNDNNPCTTDSCDPALGCIYTPVLCYPTNPCFKNAQCNNATGACSQIPNTCDDNNTCTIDQCFIEFGCIHTPIDCPATGKTPCWVLDTCDQILGCRYKPKDCDDGDPTTYDSCDPFQGVCVNTKIPCAGYAEVCKNMSTSCYIYRCDENVDEPDNCANVTITDCDDDNLCTIDKCDNSTGCQYTPFACPAAKPCHIVTCDPKLGCVDTEINCNDQNPCTEDTCNPTTNQCEHLNLCTVGEDTCTQRWCEFGQCRQLPQCLLSPDPCFVTTGCNVTLGCEFTPKCTSDDLCIISTCQADGTCVNTPKNCDDDNECTVDTCNKGTCVYSSVSCNDGDACTKDSCNPSSGCEHVPLVPAVDCNDYNACTQDVCVPATGCVHVNISSKCSDGDNCTIDYCDSVHGCVYTERTCPNSKCEIGYCRLGQCHVTKSGCIPPSIIVVTVGGGVGILVAIVISIIICVCCVAHGGAYYHGLYSVAADHFGYGGGGAVAKQSGYGDGKQDDKYVNLKPGSS